MADLTIRKGASFNWAQRWEQPRIEYRTVGAVTLAAPARLTVPGHGMPENWRFAVTGARGGLAAMNARNTPPRDSDYYVGTVIDANTIEVNKVNAANWAAYTGGGILQYNAPLDMTGCTARMQVRKTLAGEVIMEMTTADNSIEIDVDNALIVVHFDPAETSALTANSAVYDLELTFPSGEVKALPQGTITFLPEVTRA